MLQFFQSLTLDMKVLIAAMVGVALLGFFSGSRKAETRCLVVFAVLAAVGVYRYHPPAAVETNAAASSSSSEEPIVVTTSPARTPLVSTSAK